MPIQRLDYRKHITRYRKYYDRTINPFVRSTHATAYTMAIISLFTVSFFGMFAVRPTLRTIVELNRQITDSKTVSENLQKKIDTIVVAQEEYQLVKPFIEAVNQALPDEPNLTSLLTQLNGLISNTDATISALQIQPVTYFATNSSSQPTLINFSLALTGTYAQLYATLDKILTMRRTFTAESIEFVPEETDTATLKISLRLNSYYLK